jgi:hypothetical protein
MADIRKTINRNHQKAISTIYNITSHIHKINEKDDINVQDATTQNRAIRKLTEIEDFLWHCENAEGATNER